MSGNRCLSVKVKLHEKLWKNSYYWQAEIYDLLIRQDWSLCLSNVCIWILIRLTNRKICSRTSIFFVHLFYAGLRFFIMASLFDDRFVLKILCCISTSYLFMWFYVVISLFCFFFLLPLSQKLYACVIIIISKCCLAFKCFES